MKNTMLGTQLARCLLLVLVMSFIENQDLLAQKITKNQPHSLPQAINDYLHTQPKATVSIRVEDLQGNVFYNLNQQRQVPAASVIKIPILVELMEQVKAKKIRLDDNYLLQNTDKVGGAGTIPQLAEGTPLPYLTLAEQMIIASDNTATNILIRTIGRANVNARMKKLKVEKLILNRQMMDTLAVKEGRENYVNALQINQLLRLIFHKKVATPQLCDLMMSLLLRNDDRQTLLRKLPKNIKVAHKTGTLAYVRGDAGIVFANEPYVISVFVENTNTPDAEVIIGDISEIVYNHLK